MTDPNQMELAIQALSAMSCDDCEQIEREGDAPLVKPCPAHRTGVEEYGEPQP